MMVSKKEIERVLKAFLAPGAEMIKICAQAGLPYTEAEIRKIFKAKIDRTLRIAAAQRRLQVHPIPKLERSSRRRTIPKFHDR